MGAAALLLSLCAQAQAPKFEEKSDPAAKKILDKLRDKYKAYGAMTAEFTLTIEAGPNKEEQTGKIAQSGSKYFATVGNRDMICDGKTVWMMDKKANEVQISDYDPNDGEILSPDKLFRIHESDKEYIYAISSEDSGNTYIEFKPLAKNADFFKIRLAIDKTKNELKSVKVFAKDGARYTLNIKKIAAAELADTHFRFDKAKYPGVVVNDLR